MQLQSDRAAHKVGTWRDGGKVDSEQIDQGVEFEGKGESLRQRALRSFFGLIRDQSCSRPVQSCAAVLVAMWLSERSHSPLPIANSDHFIDSRYENLAVSYFPCRCCFHDGINRRIDHVVGQDEFDLYFG
jgi:hypothetical protein